MRLATYAFLIAWLSSSVASAQPAEFESCLEEGTYCSESPLDTLLIPPDLDGCGTTFYRFTGRLAFPPLINQGPITISVLTHAPTFASWYPLFVELGNFTTEPLCTTLLAGSVVLVAQGFPIQCGGVWESVGPIDLTQVIGVPQGQPYFLQVIGFRNGPPYGPGYHSAGLACVRVTSSPPAPTPVATSTWGNVKQLYQ